MKFPVLLITLSALIAGGCSTAYKTGQTPDDVYFSPSPPGDEYVAIRNNKDDQKYRGADDDEDRYLRMRIRDRYRWSQLDDWYNYERYNVYYNFGYSYHWSNPWNPYSAWNYFYNPYCHSCCYSYSGYKNPKNTAYSKPRTFNLNTFNTNTTTSPAGNKIFNSKTSGSYRPTNVATNKTSNNNNNSGLGNTLRSIFNSGSDANKNKSANSSSSGSGSSSSGSSGSSGSTAPVRKF